MNSVTKFGLAVVAVMVLMAVLSPFSPRGRKYRARTWSRGSTRPTLAHPMGRDQLGRDMMAAHNLRRARLDARGAFRRHHIVYRGRAHRLVRGLQGRVDRPHHLGLSVQRLSVFPGDTARHRDGRRFWGRASRT